MRRLREKFCSSGTGVSRSNAPSKGAAEDLREFRAPLVALIALALLFQAFLPFAAANAGPQFLGGLSICFGSPDSSEEGQGGNVGHAGACVCGPSCGHGNCNGCQRADVADIVYEQLFVPATLSRLRGALRPYARPGGSLAQSRAPPAFS
jgi:hypothetical protein